MEHAFSQNDVYDFLKLLIETGEVFFIDDSQCIFETDSRTPVGIKVGTAKKQIALYKEGTKIPPNAVYLNPFNELLGQHPEQDWFMNVISIIPGCLLLHTMKTMAELINSKTKDTKFKTAETIAKYVGRVDGKFENELQKLRAVDVGMIFYDKKKHVAQLLCDLWQDEFEEKMKSKIRKSSLTVIREMAQDILGTNSPEEMTYTATVIACPRFDAVVHVLVDALTRMARVVEKVTKYDLHTKELNGHLEHIEAYHKALQWLATSSTSAPKPAENNSAAKAPWDVTANITPTLNVTTPASANPLGNVEAVGITRNPTFAGGFTANPTFGIGTMNVAPTFDPGVPGLGRVAPVTTSVGTGIGFGNIAAQAAANVGGFGGCGFGGGFC